MNDTDVMPTGESASGQGTWVYWVTNAYDARFTNCTGDAVILEGKNWVEAQALAPICSVAASFDVTEQQGLVDVEAHTVGCSDGSDGSASGSGEYSGPVLNGQWETLSDGGVSAIQAFSSSVIGDQVTITETSRTFSGSFNGSCFFTPALQANAVIQ